MGRSALDGVTTISGINAALNLALDCERGSLDELKCLTKARDISDRFLRGQQDPVLDHVARTEDLGQARTEPSAEDGPRGRREVARAQLLKLARPEVILAPVNVVAVYWRDNPMWKSWDHEATAAVNARMLPFVQQLDPSDPVPDDPRLALPLAIAGFYLYRALHLGPSGARSVSRTLKADPDLVADVYHEIARGIVVADACLTDVARRKVAGELSGEFLDHFAGTTNAAELLLMHAVRLGPEMWGLVLQCALGLDCRRDSPYYVARPGRPSRSAKARKEDWHGACRVAKSRKGVTVIRNPKKVSR